MAMKKLVLIASLVLGVPAGAPAETALEACRDQIFEQADTNSDGVLTRSEAAREPIGMDARFFSLADKNRDGIVDYGEYKKLGFFVSCESCPGIPDCAGRG
jgi:hypothetical protein